MTSLFASRLANGERIHVEAVPGGGKTALLLSICAEDKIPTLILAYNKELASSITRQSPGDHVICWTFHALCSRTLAVTRDDMQMRQVVERAERGELDIMNVPNVTRVLIDEAQDVRELYVRLLKVCGFVTPQIGIMVAGDRNQLVYDFDPEFPSTLDTLVRPQDAFGGTWSAETLRHSHRLTTVQSQFVNSVFDTDIISTHEGPMIEICAPRPGKLYPLLREVLHAPNVLLLVDRKNGNRALKSLLNQCSRDGCNIHVHGVDVNEQERCAIHCGTFWSAKGLQSDTVVVLLPARAPRNPTYVALTRSTRRLVIVLEARDPHAPVCATIRAHPEWFIIRDDWTRSVVDLGAEREHMDAFSARNGFGSTFNLDRYQPSAASLASHCVIQSSSATNPLISPPVRGDVVVRMGCIRAELRATGSIRAIEDILHPTRLDYHTQDVAMRMGLSARCVGRYVEDDELLATDLRTSALRAYRNMQGNSNFPPYLATVALATLAWNSWDHTMRSLQPTIESWAHDVDKWVEFVGNAIDPLSAFDVRLCREETSVRVHATSSHCCYHVVWEAATSDIGAAAVRAALHPRGRCLLLEVASCSIVTLHANKSVMD